jgi:hypothetical protein
MMTEDNITESWLCVDCGINTAPGFLPGPALREELKAKGEAEQHIDPDSEMYMVREVIWKKAGMEPFGGCLCIGCLERRLGRRLKPKDFDRHSPFNRIPTGTPRLLNRQGRRDLEAAVKAHLAEACVSRHANALEASPRVTIAQPIEVKSDARS